MHSLVLFVCPYLLTLDLRHALVTGTLKGYDALMNLVLDDVQEAVRGKFRCCLSPFSPAHIFFFSGSDLVTDPHCPTDEEGNETTRPLGLVVARGTLLVVISPVDGSEVIANPFAQQEEEA